MRRTVEIIIITYNLPDYFKRCVESVKRNTEWPYKLTLIHNRKNESITKIWNRKIAKSKCEWICLLNDDTVVTRQWLTRLVKGLEDEKTAVVGPSTSLACSKQKLGEYSEKRLEYTDEEIEKIAEEVYQKYGDEIVETGEIIGFAYLFKKSLWRKAGKFNEEFILNGQESELNHRFKKMGLNLKYVKGSYVHHFGSLSIKKAIEDGKLDIEEEKERTSKLMEKYVKKNKEN